MSSDENLFKICKTQEFFTIIGTSEKFLIKVDETESVTINMSYADSLSKEFDSGKRGLLEIIGKALMIISHK